MHECTKVQLQFSPLFLYHHDVFSEWIKLKHLQHQEGIVRLEKQHREHVCLNHDPERLKKTVYVLQMTKEVVYCE